MFGKGTTAERNQAIRQYLLITKEKGKLHFLRRATIESVLLGLSVSVITELLGSRASALSLRGAVVIGSVVLSICAIGGYLTGTWKWKDLEKQFIENGL